MTSIPIDATLYQVNLEYRATWLAWLCCAFALAFNEAMATIPAAVFLGTTLLYGALFLHRPVQALMWNLIPWTFVALGMLSVIWSEQPALSLRADAQIAITVLAAIMFAQGLPARAFIAITLYALIASIVTNLFVPHIFGSKNMVGQTIALIVVSSVWVMLDKQQPKLARIIALLAFLGSISGLADSDSAGALFAGGLALLTSAIPFLLRRLHLKMRVLLIFFGAFLVFVVLGFAFLASDNLSANLLESIGKDATLTGRTMLWSHARSVIADHPFGLGLQAFWVEGSRDAIRLWEFNFIPNHMGFHFHNLWLEVGVELGLFGILIAAWTTIVVFISVLRWALQDPAPESCFFLGFLAFVLTRTFGEVELFVQFSLPPMIFMAGYYYADAARYGFRPR